MFAGSGVEALTTSAGSNHWARRSLGLVACAAILFSLVLLSLRLGH